MDGVKLDVWEPATPQELARFEELTVLNPRRTFYWLEQDDPHPSSQYTFESAQGIGASDRRYECNAFFGNFSCMIWEDRIVMDETEWRRTPTLNESLHKENPELEARAGDIDGDGDVDFAILSRRLGLVLVSHQRFDQDEHAAREIDRFLGKIGIDGRGIRALVENPVRVIGSGF